LSIDGFWTDFFDHARGDFGVEGKVGGAEFGVVWVVWKVFPFRWTVDEGKKGRDRHNSDGFK
jgi:hypothetical protein